MQPKASMTSKPSKMKLQSSPRNIKASSPSSSSSSSSQPSKSPTSKAPFEKKIFRDLTEGDKPYSIEDWMSSRSSKSEEKLRVRSVPIDLKGTYLLPDREINSILDMSRKLTKTRGKASSTPPGWPLTRSETVVVGKLQYRWVGKEFYHSCDDHWTSLPSNTTYIEKFINTGAGFILLVTTKILVQRMSDIGFTDRFPCVVVSAEGPPEYLIKLEKDLKIPVLALLTTDSKSLKMLAYYSRRLKNFKWLGLRPTDTVGLSQRRPPSPDFPFRPFSCASLKQKDIHTAKVLLKDDNISSRPEWAKELHMMLNMKYKIDELEWLAFVGRLDYLTEWYLPMKLQKEDWI